MHISLYMPSQPRYMIIEDNSLFHVTWQCHNLEWHLQHEWAKKLYYDLLLKYKDAHEIEIYSYCFMSSHPHLTGFCKDMKKFSNFFKIVNSLFARKYNKRVGRRGQLVMDRFKSPRIQTEAVHLKVMFYNDLNPKRAGMVDHPKSFKWSSYKHYAFGEKDPLITDPECYQNLGSSPRERQKEYQEMIEDILKDDWKRKKPYSSFPFIGDPIWVRTRHDELKRVMRTKKKTNTHPPNG